MEKFLNKKKNSLVNKRKQIYENVSKNIDKNPIIKKLSTLVEMIKQVIIIVVFSNICLPNTSGKASF